MSYYLKIKNILMFMFLKDINLLKKIKIIYLTCLIFRIKHIFLSFQDTRNLKIIFVYDVYELLKPFLVFWGLSLSDLPRSAITLVLACFFSPELQLFKVKDLSFFRLFLFPIIQSLSASKSI